MSWLQLLIPQWSLWSQHWQRRYFHADLSAGLAVALVLTPQALAYAQLAGLPPHIGLYAALLPALIAALFGSCPQLSTGPSALTALLAGASLMPFATAGSTSFIALAVILALLSGLIQVAMGLLRAGWLLNLVSSPVMSGFTNAAALLICLSQIPALLGITLPDEQQGLLSIPYLLTHIDHVHLLSFYFGGIALIAILGLKRLWPRAPAVLLVSAVATLLSFLLDYAAAGGAIIGDIPQGLPDWQWPSQLSWSTIIDLLPAALVVALVSFMEASACATLISNRLATNWDRNRELVGQGLAKIIAAFQGTLPVSVSFSRSALSLSSGTRTPLATVVSASSILFILLFAAPLLWHLPKAVLAAIILSAVSQIFEPQRLWRAWQAHRDDGIAASATLLGTLIFAPKIQNGILLGILISLALLLYRDMRPRTALLGLHPDGTYRDIAIHALKHPAPDTVILRFDSPLTFITVDAFNRATAATLRADPHLKTLIISASGINTIDDSGLQSIQQLAVRLTNQQQQLAFCGLKKQVIDAMKRVDLWDNIAPQAEFRTEKHALSQLLHPADATNTPQTVPPV